MAVESKMSVSSLEQRFSALEKDLAELLRDLIVMRDAATGQEKRMLRRMTNRFEEGFIQIARSDRILQFEYKLLIETEKTDALEGRVE